LSQVVAAVQAGAVQAAVLVVIAHQWVQQAVAVLLNLQLLVFHQQITQ
jgi:hypothetical protein